ncbi:PREDICTED: uncharacterized protein LOC106126000 [Papilio xuthus]|uniref:Uncharacterized protein LOC106126000 n=1 Tax=Papilio xuthus TaxID=66420 RepID=A0AAJ7EIP7_PAPXU|nr:PREDICTED: uncharacterized protein LOC106126000 [Papilio xuthus]
MAVTWKFNLILYSRAIFFILIMYDNTIVKGARLKINDLRGTDFEGNGLDDFEISNYQRSNLKVKNLRSTNHRSITRAKESISEQLKMSNFRSAYLQSTKGKNKKKNFLKTNTQSKLIFQTNSTVKEYMPTVVSTFRTRSKNKISITTNSKDKTKSKKKLKVKSTSTKKIILNTNFKKNKRNSTSIKTTTTKRRFVKEKNNIEKSTIKNNKQADEDLELKSEIKSKAINKALDLFSNSLVKSLSDQLWDEFVMKSKKTRNSKPQRNKEDSILQKKTVSKTLRNIENSNPPRKKENLKTMRQIEESVERFEIIL